MYLEIMQARFEYYYQIHERALQAADGLIDIVHVGEDLGTQRGPLISMATFDKLLRPQAAGLLRHGPSLRGPDHDAHVRLRRAIPAAADRVGPGHQDVVQPTTPEMDIAALAATYGDRLNFCGSMCVQSRSAVRHAGGCRGRGASATGLFPKGGLFLGPTHAIQVGTPIENILAMYRAAGSLREPIDDSIRSIQSSDRALGPGMLARLLAARASK